MSHIGHSIVGDRTYGANDKKLRQMQDKEMKDKLTGLTRQALHAYRLGLIHPVSDKTLEWEASVPDDFSALLARAGISVPE